MSKRKSPLPQEGSRGRIAVRRRARADEVTSLRIVRAVRTALGDAPFRSINVALLSDADMAHLHEEFMGQAGSTDVLTFDAREEPDQQAIEGDIAVSVDTARRQARRYSASVAEELLRYVIHGVLHLLGYDDSTPAKQRQMRREENGVLEMLRKDESQTSPTGRRRSQRHV